MSDQPNDNDETKNKIIQIFKDARKKAIAKRKCDQHDLVETGVKIKIEKLELELVFKNKRKKPLI